MVKSRLISLLLFSLLLNGSAGPVWGDDQLPKGVLGHVSKGELSGWFLDPNYILSARKNDLGGLQNLNDWLIQKACAHDNPNVNKHRAESLTAFFSDPPMLNEAKGEAKIFFSEQCRVVIQQSRGDGIIDQILGHFEATLTGWGDGIAGRVPGEGLTAMSRSGSSRPSLYGQYVGSGMFERHRLEGTSYTPVRFYSIDGSVKANEERRNVYVPPPFMDRFAKALLDQSSQIMADFGAIEMDETISETPPSAPRITCETDWVRTPAIALQSWIPEDLPSAFFTDPRASVLDLMPNRDAASYSDHNSLIDRKEYRFLTIAQIRVCYKNGTVHGVEVDTYRSFGFTPYGARNIEIMRKKLSGPSAPALEAQLRALEAIAKAAGIQIYDPGAPSSEIERQPLNYQTTKTGFSVAIITAARVGHKARAGNAVGKLLPGPTKMNVPYAWHLLKIELKDSGRGELSVQASGTGAVFPKHTLFLDGTIKDALGPESLADFLNSPEGRLGKASTISKSFLTAPRALKGKLDLRPSIDGVETASPVKGITTYVIGKDGKVYKAL